jgi:hypothetical protein
LKEILTDGSTLRRSVALSVAEGLSISNFTTVSPGFVGEIQDSGCIIFQGVKDGQSGYGKYFTKDGKQASMLVIPAIVPVVLIQNTFGLVLVTITN